jgi:hypothetical protein
MAEPDANMREGLEAAAAKWARRIPVDQIPYLLVFLAARLVAESPDCHTSEPNNGHARDPEDLLTADRLAGCLGVPESWVRNEERAGRIPSLRLGKYVRFKLSEVERELAERKLEGA